MGENGGKGREKRREDTMVIKVFAENIHQQGKENRGKIKDSTWLIVDVSLVSLFLCF